MKECCKKMPEGAVKCGETPEFNEKDVPSPMLAKHLTPKKTAAKLMVSSGELELVWEECGKSEKVCASQPVVIPPETPHRLKCSGPVRFKVEFWELPEKECCCTPGGTIPRPGEKYLKK